MSETDETPNLPVDVEAQIKKALEEQSGQLGALPNNKIGVKGKEFRLPDGQTSAGPLECIIVDFVWSMVNYPGAFDPKNPQQPDCFAIGREAPTSGDLKPHETVENPHDDNCATCPKNQWKSAPSGNGKACKNQRRLVVVPPNFESIEDAMTIYVSPRGLRNFDAYVSRLKSELGVLPVQVVTEVSFDADQAYPLLKFRCLHRHARVAEAWTLRESIQDMLFRPLEIDKKD